MRQGPRSGAGNGGLKARVERTPATSVDLGLALSVYGKRADGALVEIGDPASPLAAEPARTWPTEQ